MDKKESLKI